MHYTRGGKDSVAVRVAGIVPFIVMKAMAVADRIKEEDTWDIWICLTSYVLKRLHVQPRVGTRARRSRPTRDVFKRFRSMPATLTR